MSQIQCIHCGQQVHLEGAIAGTSATCPACHGSIFVPRTVPPATPAQRFATPPPLSHGGTPAKSSGGALKIILIVGVALVFFLAVMGGLVYFGWSYAIQKKEEAVAERKAEKEVLQGMATDIEKMMGEMRDENGLPKESDYRLKTGNTATTDPERMREVFNGFINDLASLQNQYLRDLDKAGLQQLMDPDRIRKDTSFEQTRKILGDCRELANNVRAKGLEYLETFPKRLDGQNFSEKMKQEIREGYADGKKASLAKFTEMWDLELSTMDQMEAACEHLSKTREAWSAQDGQLVFNNDADLEKFNGYIKKIEENTARQTSLRDGSINEAMSELKAPYTIWIK